MTTDLVVTGSAGRAARTARRGRAALFGSIVVDHWELYAQPPGGPEGDPVHMGAVKSGMSMVPETALIVATVDPVVEGACEWLDLPAALAARVHVLDLMPVDGDDYARQVTRHLARAAVEGTLPITPGQADYGRLWATASRAMCAALAPAVASRTG